MLKQPKVSDRLLAPAIAAFLGFWILALTWPGTTPIHQEKYLAKDGGAQKPPIQIQSSSADDRIAHYTALLAWFTGVLAVASLAQGFFLLRADKTARIASESAKKSADALAASERAQLMLDIYGHMVRIREVEINFRKMPRQSLAVRPNIVNYGRTPAILKEMRIGIKRLASDLAPDEWKTAPQIEIKDDALPPGAKLYNDGIWINDLGENLTDDDSDALESGKLSIYFFGHLIYEDVFGLDHEVQFCWRYNLETFRQWGGKIHNFRT